MAWFSKKTTTDSLWMKCEHCGAMVYKRSVEEAQYVCPECDWHFRLAAARRLEYLVDPGTFAERFAELESEDPLNFKAKKSYKDKLARAIKTTGLKDGAVVGTAAIQGVSCVVCVIDPNFVMGAMGSVTGEKIARGAELALATSMPYVIVSGSGGGARMEEGVLSLMQMAKTAAAIGRLRDAGHLLIVVLTNPTMGGSMASFASLGDVIIAEPKALLGFTGPRVIAQTIKREMPPGFQTAEFLLESGFVDEIVRRTDLPDALGFYLRFATETTPLERGEVGGDTDETRIETSELVVQSPPQPGAVPSESSPAPTEVRS